MEQIVIEPLRVVKLTHTKDSVLITKEDNLVETEWSKLRDTVDKIARPFREPFDVDVELNTALNKSYISVKDSPVAKQTEEQCVLGMTFKEMGFGVESGSSNPWEELAKVLEVELMIEGYTVKRTAPDTTTFIQKMAAAGTPVAAKFLVEDDCITIGVSEIFRPDLLTIDVDVVVKHIDGALGTISATLTELAKMSMPEKWRNPVDKFQKELCRRGTTIDGACVYGVAELRFKKFKSEELIIAARAAKNFMEVLGYKVEAERAVRTITPLDL